MHVADMHEYACDRVELEWLGDAVYVRARVIGADASARISGEMHGSCTCSRGERGWLGVYGVRAEKRK